MVTFRARRSEPELVVPARATPREVKSLSDIDNSPGTRLYTTLIEFFRCRVPRGAPEDPASTLKAALGEALVHYYPIAGRLREIPGGDDKLEIDCTAEGGVFVEAHADDVRLEDFGMPLVPPYPCVDELICDVGDIRDIIGKPLLYLQMTQLGCGGLVLALTMCHSVVDAFGMIQILRCILDLARGETHPAVLPSWERHLLSYSSSSAPKASPDEIVPLQIPAPADDMVIRSFILGPREISLLRKGVSATVFELVTAAIWRCRVAALQHDPHHRVVLLFTSNARGSWKRESPLPPGFYGNATFVTAAEAAAGELCRSPLDYAVGLVRQAKARFSDDFVRVTLEVVAGGQRNMEMPMDRTFLVSDITRCGDDSLDLGWAERVGGGVPVAGDITCTLGGYLMSCKDINGEECVVVPMCLPKLAMQRFTSQMAALFARSSI